MVNKIEKKFLPANYQVNFLRRMQNLKQKEMSIKDYIEEFYRLDIRYGHVDDEIEKVARYLNGLRYGIQDEISFVKVDSVELAYKYVLQVEEILTKWYEQ